MAGKRGKNDANDAEAIREAVTRPKMRFVPIRSVEQQASLFAHRARQGYIEERAAQINRMRGLLSELGLVLPQGRAQVRSGIGQVLGDLPALCNTGTGDQLSHLDELEKRFAQYDPVRPNHAAVGRMRVPVDAIVRSWPAHGVGDCEHSRQWCRLHEPPPVQCLVGATPGQHSSGGKARLGHITKTWRHVPAPVAGTGSASCTHARIASHRPRQPIGAATQGTQGLWQYGGGHCREERADVLGTTPAARRVRSAGVTSNPQHQ